VHVDGAWRVNYEVHLTVASRAGLAEACAALSLKLLDLELDQGAHPVQPMVTFSVDHDAVAGAVAAAALTSRDLGARGVQVVRTKIEVPLAAARDALYCEHHVEVVDDVRVAAVCAAHGAHLARIARRGGHTRFATLRSAAVVDAAARAAAFVDALGAAGVVVVDVVAEAVVVDTARELDRGWESA
jgi:hypothetical protein